MSFLPRLGDRGAMLRDSFIRPGSEFEAALLRSAFFPSLETQTCKLKTETGKRFDNGSDRNKRINCRHIKSVLIDSSFLSCPHLTAAVSKTAIKTLLRFWLGLASPPPSSSLSLSSFSGGGETLIAVLVCWQEGKRRVVGSALFN